MKKICVYTCITGNYDDLKEVEVKEKNVDYLCFTNNKSIKSNTWKIIYIDQENLDNQRLSRKIKMLGHPIISKNYDISVWMDASVIFKKSVRDFVSKYLKKNSFAAFKHTYRNCIYDEAIECVRLRKDSKVSILKTLDFLKSENYPKNNGLYEMTVFIKKHNDKKVIETMKLWFDMVCKYSKRDQLSFMYCAWKTGLKIDTINLSVWDNEWFVTSRHNYKNSLCKYRIYYGDDSVNYNFDLDEQNDYRIDGRLYTINTKLPVDTDRILVELTDIPCVEYSDLKVNIDGLKDTNIFNTIKYKELDVFYNKQGIVQLLGDFKKNQQVMISINMRVMDDIEIRELVEYLSNGFVEKDFTINNLENELESLRREINGILGSKSWKLTKPIRFLSSLSERK